ncbi:MAG: Yip1 family protein [Methylotenera sp.]|nr:Yip1 family protein [Methylotenera sp.]
MSILNLFWLFFAPNKGWRHLMQSKPSMHRLFLLHVMPMSLIPPLFLYFAASQYAGGLIPILSAPKLLLVAVVLFVVELVAVPLMGIVIKQLAEVAEIQPSYHDAFIFAAVAPTPLWLAPVAFLIFSDVVLSVIALVMAMMATVGFVYYGIPAVFRIKDRGHTMLMFGAVLTAGTIAWVFLMVSTLVILGAVQNLQFIN